MDYHAKILQYSSEINDQCTHKTFTRFSCSMPKIGACVKLALFCILSENKGFFPFKMLPKLIIKSTFAYLNISINNYDIILIQIFSLYMALF